MIDLSNKSILVTGGCGFIGNNFINLLLNLYINIHITNIDKLGIGSNQYKFDSHLTNNNRYKFIYGDLCDIKTIEYVLKNDDFDYIFNFAAESHVDRSIENPSAFISNNVISITNLLEVSKTWQPGVKIIHVSTDEVYGHLHVGDEPFTESSPLKPRSPYAASKAASDLVALAHHETFGTNVLVTRCCNNYGPWQHGEKFIPTVVRSLVEKRKIPVYGNGQNIREWIHVDDHNKSILEIAKVGTAGNVYNIGSGIEKTNLELIQDILTIFNISPNESKLEDHIEFVEDRKGHDFRYAIKSHNFKRHFKLQRYEYALENTVEYYAEKYEDLHF